MSRIHTILEKAERDGTLARAATSSGIDATPSALPDTDTASRTPFFADDEEPRPPRLVRPAPAPAGPASSSEPPVDAPDVQALGADATPPAPESAITRQEHDAARPVEAPALGGAGLRLAGSLVAARTPHAMVSEQFRALRTRLTHSINGRGARVVLVTSPGRGEGKSTVAANLALTMGQEIRQRVCLVDGALRHPSIHALFGIADTPGLSDVLAGRTALDAALVTLEPYQLTVLPAGSIPGNPAELLGGSDMRHVLTQLRARFDRVVVDGAATAPTADVATILPLVDGVVLVARAGVTGAPAITQAVSAIGPSHMLGVVLNATEA